MSDELPRLGFGLPVSGPWAEPATMLTIARRAEELGFASLWTFQRVLFPADGPTADDPAGRAADDVSYRAVHDPLLPLAFVAAHTSHIRLGTATICAPFTPPALLAKAMITMDHLSRGRLDVGLGIGWQRAEYLAAGVPYERRGARFEEYLRCLTALWTQDPVEFAGDFYTVPGSHLGPRPVQRPHPPLLIGGAAPRALRRAGRLAQGWIASTGADLGQIRDAIRLVHEGAREGGRDPAAVRILVRTVPDLHDRNADSDRRVMQGSRTQLLDDLAGLRANGVTEVLLDLNFDPAVVSSSAAAALEEAERVLTALAPPRGSISQPPPWA